MEENFFAMLRWFLPFNNTKMWYIYSAILFNHKKKDWTWVNSSEPRACYAEQDKSAWVLVLCPHLLWQIHGEEILVHLYWVLSNLRRLKIWPTDWPSWMCLLQVTVIRSLQLLKLLSEKSLHEYYPLHL